MTMGRTVVTGGAGFLGSHLVDMLLEKTSDQVVCIDNLSMGDRENISKHRDNPRFTFHELDICNKEALVDACKGATRIANLAAFKIPRYGGRLQTLRVNSLGMLHVLEIAKELNARVLLTSTSDVYGKSAKLPFTEDGELVYGSSTTARWAYAVSKLFDEHLAFAYQEEFNLPITIARIFGSYGPRHHLSWWGGPQSVFISALLKGEPVELHGDGLQTRSLCYVSDTVSGLFAALTKQSAIGELINIGNQQEISIMDLAKKIHDLIGVKGALSCRMVPLKEFSRDYEDVRKRIPDIRKAKGILGWEPKVPLDEGLRLAIDWQRKKMGL